MEMIGTRGTLTIATRGRGGPGERVHMNIRRGEVRRLIGSADPIEDMDGFMDLRVRAESAAETYNALKVRHD